MSVSDSNGWHKPLRGAWNIFWDHLWWNILLTRGIKNVNRKCVKYILKRVEKILLLHKGNYNEVILSFKCIHQILRRKKIHPTSMLYFLKNGFVDYAPPWVKLKSARTPKILNLKYKAYLYKYYKLGNFRAI